MKHTDSAKPETSGAELPSPRSDARIPPLRMASIPTRVKHNRTGIAADVQWEWITQTRQELQFLDENGDWLPVPSVTLPLDDSRERGEQDEQRARIFEGFSKARERAQALRQAAQDGTEWTRPETEREYWTFLDSASAETNHLKAENGWTYYFDPTGKAVARFKGNETEILTASLAESLARFSRLPGEVFQSIRSGSER